MEFVVKGQVERALSLINQYIQTDWPYQGTVEHLRPIAGLHYVHYRSPTKAIWHNIFGLLFIIALSILTSGIFFLIYWAWRALRYEMVPGMVVRGAPEGASAARLTIESDKPEYSETLSAWIEEHLVRNEEALPELTEETPSDQTSNIPDQIARLSELRDAGVLTGPEFEAKKKELLERM